MPPDSPRYQPYPTYRDSGVDWLREIPAHWKVERLKHIAAESRERLDAKPGDLAYLGLENIESQTGRLLLDAPIEDVESTVVSFRAGDVLFGKLRPYLAKVVQVDFAGVGTTELLALRPLSETDNRYVFYHLLAEGFITSVNALDYTEANMNGIPESQTAETFKRDECRFLIVAEKFQTGFDQPLLHTMYVDKKLAGVAAVQTLSRLNRVYPDKEETMVLDFANEAEEIQEGFQPYYDRTILTGGTDPNLLYDLETRLERFGYYTPEDVNRFAAIYFDPKGTQDRLHAALAPAWPASPRRPRRSRSGSARTCSATSGSTPSSLKSCRLRTLRLRSSTSLAGCCSASCPLREKRCRWRSSGRSTWTLTGSSRRAAAPSSSSPARGSWRRSRRRSRSRLRPTPIELLSAIITDLNEHFGTSFAPEDRVFIEQLEAKLAGDPALAASIQVNTPQDARLTFDHVATDKVQDLIDSNFKFYKQITESLDFARFLYDWLFDRYLGRQKTSKKGRLGIASKSPLAFCPTRVLHRASRGEL